MAFKIKSKDEKFFKFLSEHIAIALQSAELLQKIIHDGDELYEAIVEIDKLEKEADSIVEGATRKLNKLFITPIDREDIHMLAEKQDNVVDLIKGTIERMHMYNIGPATDGMKELADVIFKSVKQLEKAVDNLNNLKKEHLKLEARCNRIIILEAKGDQIYRREVARLFRENTNPIEIIRIKEVLTEMEEILDVCEKIAKYLKGIVLKYA